MFFWLLEWLGITLDYAIAGVLIIGGFYVAEFVAANPLNPLSRLFHYLGLVAVCAGVVIAAAAYGQSRGAADCAAAWKAKNYEATIANLKRDLNAKSVAADAKAKEAEQLAAQKKDADDKINEWQDYASKLSTTVAACRRATADDDRRVCDILGNAARGCQPAR